MPTAPVAEPAPSPTLQPVIVPTAAPPSKPVEKPAPVAAGPTWHSGGAPTPLAHPAPAPVGRERLELAVAYLDLGDVVTARDLLNEVAAGGDTAARDEALQLLREIG
ncbi:hypothetical protein D9M69_677270 [compost metagenome]